MFCEGSIAAMITCMIVLVWGITFTVQARPRRVGVEGRTSNLVQIAFHMIISVSEPGLAVLGECSVRLWSQHLLARPGLFLF